MWGMLAFCFRPERWGPQRGVIRSVAGLWSLGSRALPIGSYASSGKAAPGPMGTDRFREGDANPLVAVRITLAELLRPTVPAHVPTQAPPPGAAITGERATSR